MIMMCYLFHCMIKCICSVIFLKFLQTTHNQQTKKASVWWHVLLSPRPMGFHSCICLYLSCLRSAGGLYKAGRAEGSPVMWHCAEDPLPGVPRRAAHAQTEASNHTPRPQGLSFFASWISEWWIINNMQYPRTNELNTSIWLHFV